MDSLYKSAKGKKEILRLYDQKLASLRINFKSKIIQTTFGETHLLVAGDPARPPIVLVHGSNGCAPVALETYRDLLNDFSVYAIDVLAQPNKSAETRLSMKDDSYGKWMNEVISELGLEQVTLAGFSFGGLVILKTLMQNEQHVREVFLSAPAYIVNGNPLKALFRFFIPMKRYMKTENPRHLQRFLESAFTQKDEFAFRYLGLVFKYFKMDFTPVPVISSKDAQKIQTPITLFAAKNDIIFPGGKMIRRAKKIFPSLKKAILLETSRHVQDTENNSKIAAEILRNLG